MSDRSYEDPRRVVLETTDGRVDNVEHQGMNRPEKANF
jgi:hypothetical protein